MAIKLACEKAQVAIPFQVSEYFGADCAESEAFLRRSLSEVDISAALHEVSGATEQGFIVNVASLPDECKMIRFVNSW